MLKGQIAKIALPRVQRQSRVQRTIHLKIEIQKGSYAYYRREG